MTAVPNRTLYVFRTVEEAEALFPRRRRRPTDVVASANSLNRWPDQLLGQRFEAAHLFHPVDHNALRLIQGSLMFTRGALHRPGLESALPAPEAAAC